VSTRLCACGCGQPVTPSKGYDPVRGVRRGDQLSFIHGHNGRRTRQPNTSRRCACGCGQLTPLSTYSSRKRGVRKGEPLQYVHGHNRRRADRDLAVRFWEFVDKNGPIPPHRPDLGPCWIWTRAKHPAGYGLLMGPGHKLVRATHISLDLAGRPLPSGLCALHHCDNPPCVRDEHLFHGTHADNAADKIAKGRHRSQHMGAV
jgi:hypothetical protein